MTSLHVRIEPVDPLLFGDNRSARLGESHAVGDQDPSPATLFGAVGARIAYRLQARGERHWTPAEPVLGPFQPGTGPAVPGTKTAELRGYALADAAGKPWFPQPLHLRVEREGRAAFAVELLRPADAPALSSLPAGWRPLGAQVPARDEVETPLLVDEDLLAEALSGTLRPPRRLDVSARERSHFYSPEPRLGLALDNSANTAVPGRLFARPYRRFGSATGPGAPGWRSAGFLAWFQVLDLAGHPESFFNGTAFLGGDRRRACMDFAPAPEPYLPRVLEAVKAGAIASRGFLTYLLTPARVPSSGPLTFAGERPVGGAVGRSLLVSGWHAAGKITGPRPIQPLMPAGSVLFFEWGPKRADAATRERWIEESWFASLDPADAREGFGRVLVGVWS